MMEQQYKDQKEIGTLLNEFRKCMEILGKERNKSKVNNTSGTFRSFRGRFILITFILLGFLGSSNLIYGQGTTEDALFIDKNGNIGIGKTDPRTKLDVAGAITGIGMVPPGAIVMFYGDIKNSFDEEGKGRKKTAYEGWQLCNGKNNSPDLRDRFVAAAGNIYKMGETGGLDSVSLTANQMPSHNHGGVIEGATGPSQTLMPIVIGNVARQAGFVTATTPASGPNMTASPPHNHKISIEIKSDGKGEAHENRPPFFALAFIMRLPASINP
ncbi:MAG: hypothetical protein HGB33_02160 [Syntrophaceae bacterium]|nr:hypothetical protein [Syntrophaceae bacterium]